MEAENDHLIQSTAFGSLMDPIETDYIMQCSSDTEDGQILCRDNSGPGISFLPKNICQPQIDDCQTVSIKPQNTAAMSSVKLRCSVGNHGGIQTYSGLEYGCQDVSDTYQDNTSPSCATDKATSNGLCMDVRPKRTEESTKTEKKRIKLKNDTPVNHGNGVTTDQIQSSVSDQDLCTFNQSLSPTLVSGSASVKDDHGEAITSEPTTTANINVPHSDVTDSKRQTTSPFEVAPDAFKTSSVSHVPSCDIKTPSTSSTSNLSRTRRSSRKRVLTEEVQYVSCPTCGMSIKTSELASHVNSELLKLDKLPKKRRTYESCCKKPVSVDKSSIVPGETETMDSHGRYKSYLKVRTRRERRHKAKKKTKGQGDEQTQCPVCNEIIVGNQEELAEHVDQCLQQQEDGSGDELDIEGDEDMGYEEYTWAGQTRIRATTLLEGGLAASGFQTTTCRPDQESDLDLDIDGDDSNTYGEPQYTEADLLPCQSEEPDEEKERKALRNAVLRADGNKVSRTIPDDRKRWRTSSYTSGDKRIQKDCEENEPTDDQSSCNVIDSLKAKIRDQQTQLEKLERPKCLICMDSYTKPLTSVQCWHVHCEECWLRTLGTKKLCPQCNMITTPSDLRHIYL